MNTDKWIPTVDRSKKITDAKTVHIFSHMFAGLQPYRTDILCFSLRQHIVIFW
jgi:hypothetical protein